MGFDLDGWCSGISGLARHESGFWGARDISSVSFPQDGLSVLSAIEDTSFWFAHRNRFIEAAVRRLPPEGAMFDIGGGNGIVALHLTRAGFDTVVVEPSPSGAAQAHRRGLNVVAAAFEDMDVPPASLPAAGLFDVLEHVQNDTAVLQGLARAIRPGGRLYITVPAYDLLWADEDVHSGHWRRYTLTRLCHDVAAAGFRVEYASYLFAALVPTILLFRTLPYRLGRRPTHDQDKVSRDHALPDTFAGRMLQRSFELELAWARQGRRVPAGSSCFLVATLDGAPPPEKGVLA